MKPLTHFLALLVFSMFSLIACSKKDDNPQATAAKCLGMAGCPQEVMSRLGASQATQNLAMNGLNANGAPTLLPPVAGAPAPTQLANNTGAPSVIPQVIASISDSKLRQQAANVARQMAQASANPNSSYYVDPNAEDVPARNSNEQISTVPVVQSANRGPASVEPSSGSNVTQ